MLYEMQDFQTEVKWWRDVLANMTKNCMKIAQPMLSEQIVAGWAWGWGGRPNL